MKKAKRLLLVMCMVLTVSLAMISPMTGHADGGDPQDPRPSTPPESAPGSHSGCWWLCALLGHPWA